MKKTIAITPKGSACLQLLLMYTWVTNLADTDSFFSVYLLCALAGAFCLCDNIRHPAALPKWEEWLVSALAAFFGIATILANYPLFEPVTALLNIFNGGTSFLGAFFIGRSVLQFCIRRLPLAQAGADLRADRKNPCLVFFGCFGVFSAVFLFYLFSTGYPVYLAHDSLVSMEQVESGIYSNHHPYWYTRFIGLCLQIGYLFSGDINVACAAYSVIQSLLMAACLAYGVVTLYQAGMPMWCVGVVCFLYGFLPYNLTYAITMWKDTLFGGCALLVAAALYRILCRVGKSKWLNYGVFLIGGIGFCLIRNNGLPVFLVWTVLMAVFLGRKQKKLLLIAVIVLLLCWIMTGPVLSALGVADTEIVEILAVPFQQIARVIFVDGDIPPEDLEILNKIFYLDLVRANYSPEIVDPIKFQSMNPQGEAFIKENMGEFIGLWLRLGVRNPGEYVKAWVELTKGFWNGGYYFWIYVRTTWFDQTGIGGFEMNNPGKSLFDALFRYTEKPTILEPLYSIGLQVWILFTCCFTCFVQKREHWLIAIPMVVLAAVLWVMTPVYAEFRYAYPFFLICPLVLFTTLFPGGSEAHS